MTEFGPPASQIFLAPFVNLTAMPRRKNTDGDGNQTVKQPRVRKKKEPSSICSTPTAEHSSSQMKLEIGHSMPVMPAVGCGSGSQMDMMMGGPPMHMQHLPNGTPCDAGPHHQQMMEEGSNGPGGIGPPFGGGPPHSHQVLIYLNIRPILCILFSGSSFRFLSTRSINNRRAWTSYTIHASSNADVQRWSTVRTFSNNDAATKWSTNGYDWCWTRAAIPFRIRRCTTPFTAGL